jgi:hypothetical protein
MEQLIVVYRTSGSPSCWSDWQLSLYQTEQETVAQFFDYWEGYLGPQEDWTDRHTDYPDIETEVWTLREYEEYQELFY